MCVDHTLFLLKQLNTHLTTLSSSGASSLLMDRLEARDQELLVLSFLNKKMEKKKDLKREVLHIDLNIRSVWFFYIFYLLLQ